MTFRRLKNRLIAKIITRYPTLSAKFLESLNPVESEDVPWTAVTKPLHESCIALVTTSGVHHMDDMPFDMKDPDGDPTFRVIDNQRPLSSITITHDYYDHTDAERDINIIFPVQRMMEFVNDGKIGRLSRYGYSFMGHIQGRHVPTLVHRYAADVAARLVKEGVDIVFLTPA